MSTAARHIRRARKLARAGRTGGAILGALGMWAGAIILGAFCSAITLSILLNVLHIKP